jgi:hypothetical protein
MRKMDSGRTDGRISLTPSTLRQTAPGVIAGSRDEMKAHASCTRQGVGVTMLEFG